MTTETRQQRALRLIHERLDIVDDILAWQDGLTFGEQVQYGYEKRQLQTALRQVGQDRTSVDVALLVQGLIADEDERIAQERPYLRSDVANRDYSGIVDEETAT